MKKDEAKKAASGAQPRSPRATRKEAKALLSEVSRLAKRHKKRLSTDQAERLEAARLSLIETLRDPKAAASLIEERSAALDRITDELLGSVRKGSTREFFESITVAVVIALVLRAFVLEAFKIPSGSMIPTLEVGDHIFVNKFIYGLRVPFTNMWFVQWGSGPERGDVIVFRYPRDQTKDYIKRVVAVAGDHIRVEGKDVFINGVKLEREDPVLLSYFEDAEPGEDLGFHQFQRAHAYAERSRSEPPAAYTVLYSAHLGERPPFPSGEALPGVECVYGEAGRTSECVVQPEHVFVMGDNRDNSSDSRAWGGVPMALVKGKAMFVWWSRGARAGVRWDRMGQPIH